MHLRFRPRDAGAGVLHCLLVDCSGSMSAGGRLARIGALLTRLLQMAYQQRAEVALVSVAGASATTQIFPTAASPANSRTVRRWLQNIEAGGSTPLADGMVKINALLMQAKQRQPAQQRWLWLISDGRSREVIDAPLHADVRMVVDCEWQRIALGRCRDLAEEWGAEYLLLGEMEGK